MGWKTSKPHRSKSFDGKKHTDTYHTNKAGKRDQKHSKDLKVTGEKHVPSMRDIHPPKK